MILSWRARRRYAPSAKINQQLSTDISDMEIMIPTHFRCPISLDLMKDPVTLSTGITYDRDSIEKWIEEGNRTCPVSNQLLPTFDLIPNHSIRKLIQGWCVENHSYGIQRIPTPRVPVTSYEVSETCKGLMVATQRGDQRKCQDLVGKIKNWGKENERNQRCIVENGAGCVLSACFESFVGTSMEKHVGLLGEILSVLVWMFPLGVESQTKLGSVRSLNSLVWFLKSGDLSGRRNAILVLKELVSLDEKHVHELAEIEGINQALIKLIKEPICPTATKASLMTIFHMTSPSNTSEKIIPIFEELGLVSLITEIFVDGDKGTCEKALGVLDHICDSKEGREAACGNALVVPGLIKKMLRVSGLASETAVSILWKLCKSERRVAAEALQTGAFQKLLVLIQLGCGENTKEKVKDLLKILNLHRAKSDCADSSMCFKHLKKPY